MSRKDQLVKAMQELPADATWDDAMDRIAFLAKLEEGLEQSREEKGVSHEEVKKRFLG